MNPSEIEPDIKPTTKEEIATYSYQYQKEWRFEREKRLMQHALTLFPDWQYLHKRLEWHSRPIFHRDPEKSKTQPRKPLNLPRDPLYIPKQDTIDNMCFVTGASSNGVYMDLCVQLIESIKATRWYNHVPIKVLDCGLTQEDANYLRQRFGCEVKDPGWDVPRNLIHMPNHLAHLSDNVIKGITARHCLHKQFPNYQYYCWLDCDIWFQSELVLDQYLVITEQQGICGSGTVYAQSWSRIWNHILTNAQKGFLKNKGIQDIIVGGFWILNNDFMKQYNLEVTEHINNTKKFVWGTDDSLLSYTMHKYIRKPIVLKDLDHPFCLHEVPSLIINNDEQILGKEKFLHVISLDSLNKNQAWNRVLIKNGEKLYYTTKILQGILSRNDISLAEEGFHHLCLTQKFNQTSILYRIYQKPEEMYGEMQRNY